MKGEETKVRLLGTLNFFFLLIADNNIKVEQTKQQ